MARVGVMISGCGYLDGAEIQESVFTLLALSKRGHEIVPIAPDMPQSGVTDHRSGMAVDGAVLDSSAWKSSWWRSVRMSAPAARSIAASSADRSGARRTRWGRTSSRTKSRSSESAGRSGGGAEAVPARI